MINGIKIIREVYALWNNPSSQRLIPDDVVDALNRVYSQRLLDLGLSGGNYLAAVSEPFTFDAGSRVISIKEQNILSDAVSTVRVEMRPIASTNEAEWREVYLGNYADWSTYQSENKPYAAFFGTSDAMQMIANHATENNSYRIFYENAGKLEQEGIGEIEMPFLFGPLLVYDTAIEAGELIDDQSDEFERKYKRKLEYLVARQSQALKKFEKWLSERKSQSVQTRQGYSSRRDGSNILGRNFQVRVPGGDEW